MAKVLRFLAAISAVVTVGAVRAAPVTVNFEGTISGSTVTGAMPAGDTIRGSFTYDDAASDQDPDPSRAAFSLSDLRFLTALTGQYGNAERLESGMDSRAGLLSATTGGIALRYTEANGLLPAGSYLELGLDFDSPGGGTFGALPPSSSFWGTQVSGGSFYFTVADSSGHGRGQGRLSNIFSVPEPATLALGGIALGGLAASRRRRAA